MVDAAGSSALVKRASDLDPAVSGVGADRLLPVLPELGGLFPQPGWRRGSTITVAPGGSPGATTLMLALVAGAPKAGSWCAIVGVPQLGMVAAAGLGVVLERTALIPFPGAACGRVVATLLDGFDIVVTAVGTTLPPASVSTQLAARTRQSGSVLIPFGQGGRPWEGADLILTAQRSVWHGLGQGTGRLRARELTIVAKGRQSAVRHREATVWLPKDPAWTVPPPHPAAPRRPVLRLVS